MTGQAQPAIRAEKTLTRLVVSVLLKGGGSPAARAEVATGMLVAAVAQAYRLEVAA